MINTILELLDKQGPLTGKELYDRIQSDELTLWRTCNKSEKVILKRFGQRFLRLDKQVDGYARLSPSIKREFLTYTLAGLEKDCREIEKKIKTLHSEIKDISRQKFKLAADIIKKIVQRQKEPENVKSHACFIIAGDIIYDMAHSVPRPEKSTGILVRGSDLDIIAVTENLPEKSIKELDNSIYQEKYYLLKTPSYREEIDYIVKDMDRVRAQLEFNDFKSMIASKILFEGKLLYGSRKIFEKIKSMIQENKIPEKLHLIEEKAVTNREEAESYLLESNAEIDEEDYLKLFYTRQEKEEIF
jgi:hypothetical protein